MFAKLVILTIALIGLAASMLVMRQHRIELAHRAARLHHQIIQTRQEVWHEQARAAEMLSPEQIKQRLDRADLMVQHITPQGPVAQTASADQRPGRTATN
ncbi:MAG: hypothetical protein ACYTGQ_07400 [Planctomycetota bacterium]|jgi:hypothetical protein